MLCFTLREHENRQRKREMGIKTQVPGNLDSSPNYNFLRA